MAVKKSVQLFRFSELATGTLFHVTSSEEPQNFQGETFEPFATNRGKFEISDKLNKQTVKITMSLDNPLTRRWLNFINDTVVEVDIYTVPIPNDGSDINVSWTGRLSAVQPKTKDCDFVFESTFAQMRNLGLSANMEITCRHALFDSGCRVTRASVEETRAVTDLAGLNVTVPDAALKNDNFYSGGALRDNAGFLRRISSHTGDQLILSRPLPTLVAEIEQNGYVGLTVKRPTSEEGRPIPVLFGTRLLDSPNIVWWGEVDAKAVKQKGGKK